ncbi:hypothetical protein K458DRAFT_361174 [Lentithecium fluviatile CBS 122367]|uniref:Nuclear pore complex protein n=1 Tax=Lentithecium fluviatile CBS 122367 TaxID=1168545 RepID=A0A6G1JCC7_9PLEO|nr:hypothetical protein K458DRAFT_361174 [Lentithecium fluviatile CBS 122367]
MASTFSQRSLAPSQANGNRATSIVASRNASSLSVNDPLQPLRAMADRVGREVEKFAERVDHWHTHGNENEKAKYQTTVKMVAKFRDLAESNVRELKKQSSVENQGELDRSVRRRIKNIERDGGENLFGQSSRSIVPSIEPSAASDPPNVRELRHWQTELATWELLRIIIDHHHPEPGTNVAARKAARLAEVGGKGRYCPKNEVWDRFVLGDDAAQEKNIILKWLQQTAKNTESNIESIVEQWGAVSGKDTNTWTSGWLDTKAKIKQAKRVQGLDRPLDKDHTLQGHGSVKSLVTRLDPDAPVRQNGVLETSDEYYENALWMVCYEMLRRGEPWDKISEWCKERNEAWRGVSIGAAYNSHPDGGPNVAGDDLGYLFRRMCFYAARGAKMPYEGAVYALLSGDIKQVQAASRSWDDHLYAYYNGLLLSRFDRYLRNNPKPHPWVSEKSVLAFVFQDAVANFDDWETANQQVVELLKRDAATANQAKTPMKLIQGALISGTIEDLLYKVGIAIADMLQDDSRLANLIIDPDSDMEDPSSKKVTEERAVSAEGYYQTLARDPYALRILAHIFMIYREGLQLMEYGATPKVFAMENVVTAYIEFLRVTKRLQLIPLYAAQLGEWRGRHCLTRILPDIKNNDEQKRCITLMEQYRIDNVLTVCDYWWLMLRDSGLVSGEDDQVPNPISRFTIVEKYDKASAYLWPGVRIKQDITGFDISAKEEALLEALQWYTHLETDYEQTFRALNKTLRSFLLNGRLGAAEKLINDMSTEAISLSKTGALFGYTFDFTQAGAEDQDEDQVAEAMRNSTSGTHSARPSVMLTADDHADLVYRLRAASQTYYDQSQLVRLITYFRQWRAEEEKLINQRNADQQISTKRVKDLFAAIEATFAALLEPQYEPTLSPSLWPLYTAYFPELVLAYMSILQSGSFFIHRDGATKAMDLATEVASDERVWLQKVFLETRRMSELVDALALVAKAMLRLGEHDASKAKTGKKRKKGETLRIWDVNVRN